MRCIVEIYGRPMLRVKIADFGFYNSFTLRHCELKTNLFIDRLKVIDTSTVGRKHQNPVINRTKH